MQDLLITPNAEGLYDLSLDGSDLAGVDGLETAIDVTLFTDARADAASVLDPALRRGWIGDVFTAGIRRSLGSTQWIYEQSRLTQEIVNRVENDLQRAFQWFIEDGLATSVTVTASRSSARGIVATIRIEGRQGVVQRYVELWQAIKPENLNNPVSGNG